MTEPEAGSDVRGMKCFARRDGGDLVLNGTKHFISHADIADFVIVFVATGEEQTARGQEEDHCFLVDRGTPGFEIRRATTPSAIAATRTASSPSTIAGCRLRRCSAKRTGVSNSPTNGCTRTRLTVAATCVGRARRAFDIALQPCCAAKTVRPDDRQIPGRQLQARRHDHRDRRRRSADAFRGAGGRQGLPSQPRHRQRQSSSPPRCWRA